MVEGYVPTIGDIVFLSIDLARGHEERGRRPFLVLTPGAYNSKTSLAVVCPITSKVKGYPFEVPLDAGAKTKGAVLCDQVRSVDWRIRGASFTSRGDEDLVNAVRAKIKRLLSL